MRFVFSAFIFSSIFCQQATSQVLFSSVVDETTKNLVDSAVSNGRYQVKQRKPASASSTAQTEVLEPTIKLKKKNSKAGSGAKDSAANKASASTGGGGSELKADVETADKENAASAKFDYPPEKKIDEVEPATKPLAKETNLIENQNPTGDKAISEKAATEKESTAPQSEPVPDLSIVQQMKMLARGDGKKIVEMYQEQIHTDDNRNNQIEADLIPGFSYVDSSSNYSYRRYQSLFNSLDFKARFFVTPFLGFEGGTVMSLAADLPADGATKSKVTAKFEDIYLGFVSRKYFGLSRKSASLDTVFAYSDNTLSIGGSSTARFKLHTSGLGIGFRYHSPTNANFANVYSMTFWPKLGHSETSNSSASSGSNTDNYRLDLGYAMEIKFNRESQIIFSSKVSVEKNMFDGSARATDPDTGATPSNVSVINTIVQLGVGYRWGR